MSESPRRRDSLSDDLDGLPNREEFDLDWNWDQETPDPEMWSVPESGPIPPEVPWSEMVTYQCRHYHCRQLCLNHVEESCTQFKECWTCHRTPVLGNLDPITYHLPDKYAPGPETEAVEE